MAHIVLVLTTRKGIERYLISRETTRMVRKFAALFALVLTFGLAVAPVAAQDLDTDSLEALGLESGYLRMFVADPAVESANPDLLGVMVVGLEFDNADTVDDAFEDFTCGFAGGFLGVAAVTDCDGLVDQGFNVSDVDGMGDQAIEVTGEADVNGPTPVNILALQSDNHIFVVINLGTDTPGSGDDFGTFLADAEPVDTDVEFNSDGTSTGGFFDMLPQEGDELIDGFMPLMDQDLFGTVTGTPAS